MSGNYLHRARRRPIPLVSSLERRCGAAGLEIEVQRRFTFHETHLLRVEGGTYVCGYNVGQRVRVRKLSSREKRTNVNLIHPPGYLYGECLWNSEIPDFRLAEFIGTVEEYPTKNKKLLRGSDQTASKHLH
jgi:hypothetical protein